VSNSNNLCKEIKRLRKEVAGLGAMGRKFHFLVLGKDETEEEKLRQMIDAGKFAPGDEYQVVQLWIEVGVRENEKRQQVLRLRSRQKQGYKHQPVRWRRQDELRWHKAS